MLSAFADFACNSPWMVLKLCIPTVRFWPKEEDQAHRRWPTTCNNFGRASRLSAKSIWLCICLRLQVATLSAFTPFVVQMLRLLPFPIPHFPFALKHFHRRALGFGKRLSSARRINSQVCNLVCGQFWSVGRLVWTGRGSPGASVTCWPHDGVFFFFLFRWVFFFEGASLPQRGELEMLGNFKRKFAFSALFGSYC